MRLVPITLVKKNHVCLDRTYSVLLSLLNCAVSLESGQQLQVTPDDNSKLVPPLPIPNRTVKQPRADDSAETSAKVGHRQAFI